MNWNQIWGKWKQAEGRVKAQSDRFTNNDLRQVEAKRERLDGFVEEPYGRGKERGRREEDFWWGV